MEFFFFGSGCAVRQLTLEKFWLFHKIFNSRLMKDSIKLVFHLFFFYINWCHHDVFKSYKYISFHSWTKFNVEGPAVCFLPSASLFFRFFFVIVKFAHLRLLQG